MLEKSTRASNWQLLEPKRPQLDCTGMDGTGLCTEVYGRSAAGLCALR